MGRKVSPMRRLPTILTALALLAGLILFCLWWSRLPVLTVFVDPALRSELDTFSYRQVFAEAGVFRVKVLPFAGDERLLGDHDGNRSIAIVLENKRNPLLDDEMITQGLTGPGYTEGWIAKVYAPDIDLFLEKYSAAWAEIDRSTVRRRLITNTAVHESWHAIAQSHSHNPVDQDSVMFMDPGKAPESYGGRVLRFTRGHLRRLQEIFSPRSS